MTNLMLYGVSSLQGGVETFIFNLIEHLDRNRFNLFLLVNTEDYVEKEWLESKKVKVIVGPNRRSNPFLYKSRIRKILKDNKIDIVWSNLTSLSDITLLSAAKAERIRQRIVYSHQSSNMGGKLTGHLHDINKKYRLKQVATDFWACSDLAWKYFYGGIKEFGPNDVFVNAVDPNKFKFNSIIRDKKRNELKLSGKFVLGTVGRLTTEKNQKFLVELVKKLENAIPNIQCVIVGSGVKQDELNELIKQYSLFDKVNMLGQRTDVPELLNAFDVFVLPSLFEGLPFVLVEAQMNGLDVIVSDQVSTESGFTNRIHFLPLDLDQWAEKVKLVHSFFERKSVDSASINETEFNIHNNIKEFEKRLI